ncbi:MAG: extracellular solute-binding protein [Trueperaceae bacterium]|nr:extracellular solute-binding protein [Trueperaceae bacterium]
MRIECIVRRLMVVCIATVVLAGFGSVLAQPSGSLSFYTSMQVDVVEDIITAFEAAHPGVTVELLYSGSVELEQRIYAERDAGQIRADVIWAANPAFFLKLKDEGLLMAYESPEAHAVPAGLKDEDHMFIAGRVFNMGIGYNTSMVSEAEAPKSWAELLEWGSRAAMASPLHSGTSFTALGAFVQNDDILGWEWFEQARENGMQVLRGTGDVTRGLTSGEFPVIKGIDYVLANQAAEGAPVAFLFPEEGAVTVASPLAIPAGAANVAAAQAFIDYIISQEGQEFMATKFFIPVRTDVDPPAGLPTADQIVSLEVDYDALAAEDAELRERFSELF